MSWIWIGILVAVVVAVIIVSKVLETVHIGQLALGFLRIQEFAVKNVSPRSSHSDRTVDSRQCFTTCKGFQLVYTCDLTGDGQFLHRLAGSTRFTGQKDLMCNLLLAMGFLLKKFESGGFASEVEFNMIEVGPRAHILEFTLTPEQQSKLLSPPDTAQKVEA